MNKKINQTMMQYFEWYLPADCGLWKKVANEASYLDSIGITGVWLPPAYKGEGGNHDTGYGVYDLYDLGEFDQKGSVNTKYGSKDEYINAIKVLKGNNLEVYADIVLNHRLGADGTEEVMAMEEEPNNRNVEINAPIFIEAWTKYNFDARNNKYSDFKWNWTHFHGVDWDEKQKRKGIFKFYGKHWDVDVDKENGNFDYLMGADVDFNNVDVIQELNKWGDWYVNTTNVDGFRLDAVKHIRAGFYKEWLENIKEEFAKDFFTVGEYWSTNNLAINNYLKEVDYSMKLFDVPLHYNLFNASNSSGNYDMRTILDNTLVKENPEYAVTFVDNHDTQLGQSLNSWIQDWFKPLAYALILLRKDGIPCIFYGDYYGIEHDNIPPKKKLLENMIKARKHFSYGKQRDYFKNENIIGWVREGDSDHTDSGLAVVMSDNAGGCIEMNMGERLANTVFYDCTGNLDETVYVDANGNGIFYCDGGSVSVWIKKDNIYDKSEEE